MKESIYIFIDTQNLIKSTLKQGWSIDFKKLFIYLKNKFRFSSCILFIGYIKEYSRIYKKLHKIGYEIIFKDTVRNIDGKYKGNVDVEIAVYACAALFNSYTKAVIITGDGDLKCVLDFIFKKGKLLRIVIPDRYHYSKLFRPYKEYFEFLDRNSEMIKK